MLELNEEEKEQLLYELAKQFSQELYSFSYIENTDLLVGIKVYNFTITKVGIEDFSLYFYVEETKEWKTATELSLMIRDYLRE